MTESTATVTGNDSAVEVKMEDSLKRKVDTMEDEVESRKRSTGTLPVIVPEVPPRIHYTQLKTGLCYDCLLYTSRCV